MYRTIDTAFWTDPRVRQLDPDGKLLFLYLITNSHAHVSGIYYLPAVTVVHETGLPRRALDTLWDTLSHRVSSPGLVRRDEKNEVVWVIKMLERQGRGDKINRSAASHLHSLHNSPLVKEFLECYPAVKAHFKDRVSIGYPDLAGFGIQEQEQEQEQEHPLPPHGDASGFARFWAAYPRHTERKTALEVWQRLKVTPDLEATILAAISRQRQSEQWQRGVIPHPATWLRKHRWEDEPILPLNGHAAPTESAEEIAERVRRERAERQRQDAEAAGFEPPEGEQP